MKIHHKQSYYQINEDSDSFSGPAEFHSASENQTSTFGSTSSEIFNTNPGFIVDDIDITNNDVLSGRGKGATTREGNQFYLRLIKQYKDEYQNQKFTKMKRKIAQRVLYIIKHQEPQGRFMKSEGGKHNSWIVQDDVFATMKITQALREKPKKTANMKDSTLKGVEGNRGERKKRKLIYPSYSINDHHGHDHYNSNGNDHYNSIAAHKGKNTNIDVALDERPLKKPSIYSQSKQKFSRRRSSSLSFSKLMNESLVSFESAPSHSDNHFYNENSSTIIDQVQGFLDKPLPDDSMEGIDDMLGTSIKSLSDTTKYHGSETIYNKELTLHSNTKSSTDLLGLIQDSFQDSSHSIDIESLFEKESNDLKGEMEILSSESLSKVEGSHSLQTNDYECLCASMQSLSTMETNILQRQAEDGIGKNRRRSMFKSMSSKSTRDILKDNPARTFHDNCYGTVVPIVGDSSETFTSTTIFCDDDFPVTMVNSMCDDTKDINLAFVSDDSIFNI